MIVPVTEDNLVLAAQVHAVSWRESHGFCSPEFVALHTTQRQMAYLRDEIQRGKRLFLLEDDGVVGIVSVCGHLIENLYVLPERHRMGYGTRLLWYAEDQCDAAPELWVLSNNMRAQSFYEKNGYHFTGREKVLSGGLKELEMTK